MIFDRLRRVVDPCHSEHSEESNSIFRIFVNQNSNSFMKRPSLLTCVLLDIAGYLTYLIPFLGEWGDGLWAPLSAFLFYRMFGGRTGKTGAIISFIEEILPFTDFIPTFTIGYFVRKREAEKQKTTS